MRLINCDTLLFEEFFFKPPPPYAILSHTWDEHEITFQEYYDYQARARHPVSANKIANACAKAKRHGSKYMWIDSCSIDKSSSNEFSEAINSMFKWYQNSERCYVYLSDFNSGLTESRATNATPITGAQIMNFKNCKWFSRGWTLQELLAPRNLIFYDVNWLYFGSASELAGMLSSATRIPQQALLGTAPLYNYSVAQKMSWAATRRTTREEDMAYCLLGLFDVNMPLFYGEGARKAFFRLQEAIMRESNDLTLFAWQSVPESCYRGILARSPSEFYTAGDITHLTPVSQNPEFAMTNKGLKIESMLERSSGPSFMPLNCTRQTDNTLTLLGVNLVDHSGIMIRDSPEKLLRLQSSGTPNWTKGPIYIAKDVKIHKSKGDFEYPVPPTFTQFLPSHTTPSKPGFVPSSTNPQPAQGAFKFVKPASASTAAFLAHSGHTTPSTSEFVPTPTTTLGMDPAAFKAPSATTAAFLAHSRSGSRQSS
ncbi:HET-domain-containing protein [Lentithecium fluviatile CBS 122367]|uniref:HET-domain-containing protein n=1 Tax=Lentithecium fluviatile CBS 122367 TaxID=1168545 RepID=A0A6G1JJJ5_9PLEO|nr:HET-domain-containing protein [Lentithecium fluviatile CBS 122367]